MKLTFYEDRMDSSDYLLYKTYQDILRYHNQMIFINTTH